MESRAQKKSWYQMVNGEKVEVSAENFNLSAVERRTIQKRMGSYINLSQVIF